MEHAVENAIAAHFPINFSADDAFDGGDVAKCGGKMADVNRLDAGSPRVGGRSDILFGKLWQKLPPAG